MIDFLLKSPKAIAFGLFLLLSACQQSKTPEQITLAFWSAMASNDLNAAKNYCSLQLPCILTTPQASIKNASFNYGKIVIDGSYATVDTQMVSTSNTRISFTTFLVKENTQWKVDYQRSSVTLESNPLFKGLFNTLRTLGETLNKQLEQQLPLLEKEIESFSEQLKQQIDDFEDTLKKSFPEKQPDHRSESI